MPDNPPLPQLKRSLLPPSVLSYQTVSSAGTGGKTDLNAAASVATAFWVLLLARVAERRVLPVSGLCAVRQQLSRAVSRQAEHSERSGGGEGHSTAEGLRAHQ